MYVGQIIALYDLNVYSGVCRLYLNKTRRKKTKSERVRASLRLLWEALPVDFDDWLSGTLYLVTIYSHYICRMNMDFMLEVGWY